MKRSAQKAIAKILAETEGKDYRYRAYSVHSARRHLKVFTGVEGGALRHAPGAIEANKFVPAAGENRWDADGVRRAQFDLQSVAKELRARYSARGAIDRLRDLHVSVQYERTGTEPVHQRVYHLPEGTPAERVADRTTQQVARALSSKGISWLGQDRMAALRESIPAGWVSKVRQFCLAAPRQSFITDAKFDGLGDDMAMCYLLTEHAVFGRGHRRTVKIMENKARMHGAVISIDDDEFVGVARTRHAAIAKARAAAGEAAAKTLSGEFEGGFL